MADIIGRTQIEHLVISELPSWLKLKSVEITHAEMVAGAPADFMALISIEQIAESTEPFEAWHERVLERIRESWGPKDLGVLFELDMGEYAA